MHPVPPCTEGPHADREALPIPSKQEASQHLGCTQRRGGLRGSDGVQMEGGESSRGEGQRGARAIPSRKTLNIRQIEMLGTPLHVQSSTG